MQDKLEIHFPVRNSRYIEEKADKLQKEFQSLIASHLEYCSE